jgi:adenylate cyclase
VPPEQRRLAAIMSADVVGYSRLMGRDESGTVARLRALRKEHFEPVLARHKGRVVKLTGDGALVEFASAVEALAAAIEFQQATARANDGQTADDALVFRIGLHLGDVIVDGDDLYGDGVNIAARLEGEAPAGGIVVSGDVHNAVAGRLKAAFVDLGDRTLKNIDRPVRSMRVTWVAADWPAVSDTPAPAMPSGFNLALPDKPSVAVLPFDNMSGDPEQAYFADGLAEDLITGLSRVSWLFVIARNSSFAFRGEKFDVRSIGERLGVRYLVQGSVRRAGQRLRLTAQLIEAATGNHLWAERYDGSLEDVFDFQDRLVVSLVSAIEPKLRATEVARARRKRPDSLDAFDLLLQALPKWATISAQGLAEAIELLDRAVSLSPEYARALAEAAICRVMRPLFGYSADGDKDLREAVDLSRRALEADPMDSDVLRVAGLVAALLRRDYQAGWDLVDRALAIDPNSAIAWFTRGTISAWAGETEMATTEFQKAMRLSPHDPQRGGLFNHGMANALALGGRPQEALPWARRVVQDLPDFSLGHRTLVASLWLSGRHTEAREAARRHIDMFPGYSVRRSQELSPLRRSFATDRYFDALRAAGLPE